jgi:putative membrane protein
MEMHNFTNPTRQNKAGLVVLFLQNLFKVLKNTFFIVLLLGYRLYEKIEHFWLYVVVLLLIILVFSFWIAYKSYKNFVYYVDEGDKTFVLEQGIFTKVKTIINFDKIVQINLVQPLLLQVLDLYKLNIETAGSAVAEVHINALDEPTALALQSYLQKIVYKENTDESVLIDANTPLVEDEIQNKAANPIIKIPNWQILMAGIFTNYANGLGFALLSMSFIVGQLKEYEVMVGVDAAHWVFDFFNNSVLFDFALLFILFLLSPIIINLFRQVIRYFNLTYNYKLANEIQFEYGLFELHKRIFNIDKLQIVKIKENVILLQLKFIILKQIQTGAKDKSALQLPGLRRQQVDEMLLALFKQPIKLDNPMQPSIRKFFIQFMLIGFVVISLGLLGIFVFQITVWYILLTVTLLLSVIGLILYKRVRYEKFFWCGNLLVIEKGWLEKTYTYCSLQHIQIVKRTQMLWQRKHNLGSLQYQTGAGTIYLDFYNYDFITELADSILYKIELNA